MFIILGFMIRASNIQVFYHSATFQPLNILTQKKKKQKNLSAMKLLLKGKPSAGEGKPSGGGLEGLHLAHTTCSSLNSLPPMLVMGRHQFLGRQNPSPTGVRLVGCQKTAVKPRDDFNKNRKDTEEVTWHGDSTGLTRIWISWLPSPC